MTAIRELITTAATLAACAALAAAPGAGADPEAAVPSADPLVLSVEEVGGIAGNAVLTPDPALDLHQPGGKHEFDAKYPPVCHPVFDQDVAFGKYGQFRSVTYTGAANMSVTQAVAIYPSGMDAKVALKNLNDALMACSNQNIPDMTFTTQVLDPLTLAVCFKQCATIYRVVGPALIGVSAERFGDSDRIATAVLQQITGRAKAL